MTENTKGGEAIACNRKDIPPIIAVIDGMSFSECFYSKSCNFIIEAFGEKVNQTHSCLLTRMRVL